MGSPFDETALQDTSGSTNLLSESSMSGGGDSSQSDRKEMSSGKQNVDEVNQKDIADQNRLREISGGSFAGQNKHQSLATNRWKRAYEFVRRTNELKRQALTTPLANGARMHGHAFGILGIHSEFRRSLFDLLYNEKSEYVLLFLIFSHIFVLVLLAHYKFVTPFHPTKSSLESADLAITIIYTIECISRIIALGLYRGPHAYLRNNFNKLDLVIVMDSWAHIIRRFVTGHDAWIRLAVLRIFRALLVIRHLSLVGDIFAIIDAIRVCVTVLEKFFVLTLMFLSFFALMGVQLFGGAFHTRCQRMYDGAPTYPPRFCFRGWVRGPIGMFYGDNCNHLDFVGFDVCLYSPNPNYGSTHFDNFAASLLIVFQVTTFEGWALIMKWAGVSTGLGADAYFIVLVIAGGYFLVNIYVAVISAVFLKVRHEHRVLIKRYRKDKTLSFANAVLMATVLKDVVLSDDAKLNWTARLRRNTTRLSHELTQTLGRQSTKLRRTMTKAVDWNDPNSYLKRLSSFGLTALDNLEQVQPEDPALPRTLSRNLSRTLSRNLSYAARFGRTFSRSVSMTGQNIRTRISTRCWIIVHSKAFSYGVLFFISFNMAALCSVRANMSRRHTYHIQHLEIALIAIFGAELLIRYLAGGFSGFVEEPINVVDLVVVVFSAFNTGPNRRLANITPIRLLRWFYVKRSRRVHRGGDSVPILASILRSVEHLLAVYAFLFLVVFIFSVFSMELWGGEMYFDDGYPRANHDTLGQAMLLWFTVTTGESWVDYMWDAMRPGVKNRWAAPYIFVLYYVITSIVVLNLIIATILEETELTDGQKKYIQKRDHLKWLQAKHYHHVSSTRHADWIIDAVEGAQKSFVDVKRRMTSMRVSRLSLFPSSRSLTPGAESSEEQQHVQRDEPMVPSVVETEGSKSSSTEDPLVLGAPQEAPTRSSYSQFVIPGSTQTDDTSTEKPVRRASASGGVPTASDSTQTLPRRRGSLELNPLMVRSGFTDASLVEGGVKTALQSALVAVADEQAKVAASTMAKTKEGSAQPSSTTPGPSLGRTASGRKISFVLSEFDTSPTFVVRAVPWWMNDRSLFLFRPDNVIRRYITKAVEHKMYTYLMWIMLACGLAGLEWNSNSGYFEDPTESESGAPLRPWGIHKTFTALICLDVLLRCIAYGALFTRESFLSDPYNMFDMVMAVFAIMRCFFYPYWWEHHSNGLFQRKWNKVNAWLMLFRPLMIIGRFMGLRTLMGNVIRTMPVLGQLFVFVVAVYAIFATLGVQLYANRFRYCSDPNAIGHNDCVGFYRNEVGVLAMRTWVNPDYHFDTFGDAMLALFVGSTFDSWTDNFLFPAMDLAHEEELQPQRNQSPAHAIFFVAFMCVGGIFILRMFVGVFCDQFGIMSGSKLLTERQELWRDANRLIQGLKPRIFPTIPSLNPLRRFCFRIVYSRKFELMVVFVIVVNFLYMTTRHVNADNDMPQDMYDDGGINSAIETMFVCLYGLEVAMKLLGTGLGEWWHDKWNVTELCMFIISASCLYPELVSYVPSDHIPHLGNKSSRVIPDFPGIPGILLYKYPPRQFIGATFIFIRIFRIIRYFEGLRIIVTTIMIAMPAMVDTMALMFVWVLFLMGYGYLAFLNVKSGNCITRTIGPNFESMTKTFSVMMQIMTLDNWSCLLKDITVKPPFCNTGTLSELFSDCGAPAGGILFVLVTVAVTTYIFSNVFVAQILDTVTFSLIHEKNLLAPEHIMAFQDQWGQPKYDPRGTGYIGQHKLKEFLIDLGYPLGGRRPNFHKWYTRIEFEVQHFRGEKGIAFRPLLETVCLYKVGPRGLELPVRIERERQIQNIYQKGAAYRIQALIRGFLQRRKSRKVREVATSGETTDSNDQGEDAQGSVAKQQQQSPSSVTPSASSTSGWATASSTSGWASTAASDTHSEKAAAESSDDDEGSLGGAPTAAASSVYETPMSHTPPNELDSDPRPEIGPAEKR